MDVSMRNFQRRCAVLIAGLVARVSVPVSIPLRLIAAFGPIALCARFTPALAQQVYAPRPWEMGMQAAGGPLKQEAIDLHDGVLVVITLITLFVAGLLGWVMWRYNARRNPIPSATKNAAAVPSSERWTPATLYRPNPKRKPTRGDTASPRNKPSTAAATSAGFQPKRLIDTPTPSAA